MVKEEFLGKVIQHGGSKVVSIPPEMGDKFGLTRKGARVRKLETEYGILIMTEKAYKEFKQAEKINSEKKNKLCINPDCLVKKRIIEKETEVQIPSTERINIEIDKYFNARINRVKEGLSSEDFKNIKKAFAEIAKVNQAVIFPEIKPENLQAIKTILSEEIGCLDKDLRAVVTDIINSLGYEE